MKGLVQKKASTGGTPMRAPLGYLNTLHRDELGREVREALKDDEKRAALIQMGISPLTQPGTTVSRSSAKNWPKKGCAASFQARSVKPDRLGISTVHPIFRTPTTKGTCLYRGVRYDGVHERLIEPEVWYQVQTMLRSLTPKSACAPEKHDHYLKGTLYCGRCRQRMTIIHAKNRHGNIYPYFICLGRNKNAPTA